MSTPPSSWRVFRGGATLPPPPPWRRFGREARQARGQNYLVREDEIDLVNAALYLRRPLLVTGKPGTGKTTLAYAVAHELQLGPVLLWPITTRSTLQEGLYRYDALARLQDASIARPTEQEAGSNPSAPPPIGRYLRLGPLGTALLPRTRPRVLLIDEIDKSDIDLPNDLLNVFEEGEYEIPELARVIAQQPIVNVPTADDTDRATTIKGGRVRCEEFPLVIMTSNGERDFPPAFLRRCLRLDIRQPNEVELAHIVQARLALTDAQMPQVQRLILDFIERRDEQRGDLATDQLLNALYLVLSSGGQALEREALREALFRALAGPSA